MYCVLIFLWNLFACHTWCVFFLY